MSSKNVRKLYREAARVKRMYDKIDAEDKAMKEKAYARAERRELKALRAAQGVKPKKKNKKATVIKACSLLGFFLIWQAICMINSSAHFFNPKFLPSPTDILQTGYEFMVDGTLWSHLTSSLYRTLFGFALGVAVALILGILTTSIPLLDNIISPILNMVGPIPVFAFLPMFIIWFGIGEESKIVLIAYATFMPLLTYTVDGIKNTNPVLIRSAKSLGANQFQIFTKVILKSALPNVFVGMKVSLALTFSALVVAEMMGASKGLGFMINDARNWFKLDQMFLAAALIGVEYTIFYGVLSFLEKILFKWKRSGLTSAVE